MYSVCLARNTVLRIAIYKTPGHLCLVHLPPDVGEQAWINLKFRYHSICLLPFEIFLHFFALLPVLPTT
jgi:hypothetical protein